MYELIIGDIIISNNDLLKNSVKYKEYKQKLYKSYEKWWPFILQSYILLVIIIFLFDKDLCDTFVIHKTTYLKHFI